MKKIFIILISCIFLFGSCDNYIEKNKKLATAYEINGLLVFIKATPVKEYTSLGAINNDDVFSQVGDATKGKKFGQALKGLIQKTKENTDFSILIKNMVDKAKESYKTADAVIFQDNLSSCQVIKFE